MITVTTVHVAAAQPGSGTAARMELWMLRTVAVAVAATWTSSSFVSAAAAEAEHTDSRLQASLLTSNGISTKETNDFVAQVLAPVEGKTASLLESLLASFDVLLSEFGLPATSVVCAALAITVLTFIFIRKAAGGGGGGSLKRRKGVLFLGPCGAGKTAMMHKLCHNRLVPTVTSMQPCTYLYRVDKDGGGSGGAQSSGPSAPIVDYPGHERLRGGVGEELRTAERVVFVLDGSCLAGQVAAGAELLYDVLSDPSMEGCQGILLALNKNDLKEAKAARAKTLLQKELEKLRGTRGTLGTQGEEDDLPTALALGRPGQPFSLDVDSPCEVVMATCSVMDGNLDAVADFVRASSR